MSSEQSPFPSMTLLLCGRPSWWDHSQWTDWVLEGMPLQFWKVCVTKIFMWNLNSISTGLLEANINTLNTGELVAMSESVRASYHVGILLFGNLCFSKRMYSLSFWKKNVACWGFKSMCAESLSPLHIFIFLLTIPFWLLYFICRIDLFPNTCLKWIIGLREAFLHIDVYSFCLVGG